MTNQQYPQYPMPPQGQPQQPQQAYPQQPQYPQAPQYPAGPAPQVHHVDEAAMKAQMEQDKADKARRAAAGGPRYNQLKIPGPAGETKWGSVPVGYSNFKMLHICPPAGPGKMPVKEKRQHFFRSYEFPKGRYVKCTGESCPICAVISSALENPNPEIQKKAKEVGRINRKYLYNVIDLSAGFNAHVGEDGIPRPFILEAGVNLRDDINEIFDDCGFIVMYPESSRPIKIKKSKTGPEERNVDYSARQQDVTPLSAEFYPILNNLWDLDSESMEADGSPEMIQKCIQSLGVAPQASAAYQQQPAPPYGNPYQAPPPPPAQAYPQQQYPQQQYPQPPQQAYQPPPMQPPPMMAPPPMQAPQAPPTAQYQPQVGMVPPPPPPPPGPAAMGQNPAPAAPQDANAAELAALQQQLAGN